MIDFIQWCACRLAGRRFRYRTSFKYQTADGTPLFTISTTMGVARVRAIDDHREMKVAMFGDGGEIRKAGGRVNGRIAVETVCYLGWF